MKSTQQLAEKWHASKAADKASTRRALILRKEKAVANQPTATLFNPRKYKCWMFPRNQSDTSENQPEQPD